MKNPPKHILPIIVFAQFAGTSLWFAGNAIIGALQQDWSLPSTAIASITSAVMLGFITGTLLFALFSIADRFKASLVFLACSVLGALANVLIILLPPDYNTLLAFRFLTGIFLAGIYPVGMKISADWFAGKLGNALGYLVGALVIGSAFPHLLNYFGANWGWEEILLGTSILAVSGGIAMAAFVGDGPHRTHGSQFQPKKLFHVFKVKSFRNAAFGYFGHMWELYTLWAFLPLIIQYYNQKSGSSLNLSLWTFLIMAIGALGCIIGGRFSIRFGSAKVATTFLTISGILCLLSPLIYELPEPLFLLFMLVWGFAVIGDSAQFSSLNALTAPPVIKGTALTLAVSIGFFLTIPSIQLLGYLSERMNTQWLLFTLIIGPIFGFFYSRKLIQSK